MGSQGVRPTAAWPQVVDRRVGQRRPEEGLDPWHCVAVLDATGSCTGPRGTQGPDCWSRSHMGWVAAGGRKLNFPEDFGTKRIHGSDSGCLS